MAQILAYDPQKPWLGGNIKGGDPNTYCPPVWDFLIREFNPQTLCDVGCGEGYLIDYFQIKGVKVTGIDGLPENKISGPVAVRRRIIVHDFQNPYPDPSFYDMVISCEFVEHVDEIYCLNYLEQFRKCNILVFTHALPGQIGHNHVNCKDDRYWITIMKVFNFTFLEQDTLLARELAENSYWNTTLIFKNTYHENTCKF